MKKYIFIILILISLVGCSNDIGLEVGLLNENEFENSIVNESILDIINEDAVEESIYEVGLELEHELNHLRNESSPYLQQHATNPVDWYPYSPEAFEKARDENKLIFLSIGYSTCHWCHVMMRESFEDEEVATVLNEHYISIKVDREERPDIDFYFMNLYQQMNGSGGWPLNVIMTPDEKMFYGATYLPKNFIGEKPGLIETLTYLQDMWVNETDKILSSANNIEEFANSLNQIYSFSTFEKNLDVFVIEELKKMYDKDNGGFSISPKFPSTNYLEFILKYGSNSEVAMATNTLNKIIFGGITDQIGGGFHRYAIDSKWQIPHFEKMLYDQASLIDVLSLAYKLIPNEDYKNAIYETIYFVNNTLSDDSLYYSAIDAESEHEEGKYYIWTYEEIKNLLSKEEFELIEELYSIKEKGNYLDEVQREYIGQNILYRNTDILSLGNKHNYTEKEIQLIIDNAENKLLRYRENRVIPSIDKKILTDWNGMYIHSLFSAAEVLEDNEILNQAINSLRTLEIKMIKKDSENNILVYHNMLNGILGQEGFLDDYAYLLKVYLKAYDVTSDVGYLESANDVGKAIIDIFYSEDKKGFLYSNIENISKTNQKKYLDVGYASGYSIAVNYLNKLGKITANSDFGNYALYSAQSIAEVVNKSPFISLNTVEYILEEEKGSYEIVIVKGTDENEFNFYLDMIRKSNISNVTIILKTEENKAELELIVPFTKSYESLKGNTTIYICKDSVCRLPIFDLEILEKTLLELNNN